jgi:hypothetical protein
MYMAVDVQTSTLHLSTSWIQLIIFTTQSLYTDSQWIEGWVGASEPIWMMWRAGESCSWQNSNPNPLAVQSVASSHSEGTITAPQTNIQEQNYSPVGWDAMQSSRQEQMLQRNLLLHLIEKATEEIPHTLWNLMVRYQICAHDWSLSQVRWVYSAPPAHHLRSIW